MENDQRRDDGLAGSILDPRLIDPHQQLVTRTGLGDGDVDQIVRVLEALQGWREAEQRASEASRKYMQLNETDMKALRFLMAAQNQNLVATPGALAAHLEISTAATTKVLDRLAHAGHITRSPHPTDRRALAIAITPETYTLARETVGRQHVRRFDAAARLTPAERETVIRFLEDLGGKDPEPPPA
ncbi:MarR family transcriptional regulator [Arthrobacter sp. I2-34]|uniref:MarR family transcriptional regulator n=1 Tax=Arthrobacter hankyongi TaxID=2904801 RepID=A0ABS9LBL9_9MICC|nr:MarR family transcriptional regulator [Arthrobacter hankyongi]MCG2624071.1 MarR family transcriptional regulator [Arthrobacter hankyongi]